MKYVVVLILALAIVVPAFGKKKEKVYEDAFLEQIRIKQVVDSYSWPPSAAPTTTTFDRPMFLVTVGDMQYDAECTWTPAREWTAGTPIKVRFNKDRDQFWMLKPNGKDEGPCDVETKKAK